MKADAEERGEDVERKKNWEWTIEENDEWEKKKRRKERGADFEFHSEFRRLFLRECWRESRNADNSLSFYLVVNE